MRENLSCIWHDNAWWKTDITAYKRKSIVTDTLFARSTVRADFPVIKGRFQPDSTNSGVIRITKYIEWSNNNEDMKAKIKALEKKEFCMVRET